MRPALALFLTALLLWAGVACANHALAGMRLYLFAGGLFLVAPALRLPLESGLAVSLAAGAVCDANAPVPFGTHVLLFAAAHVLIFAWRDRLPPEQPAGRVTLALAANLALFIALSLLEGGARVSGWRLAADLACSEACVALAAPWFFALQERALLFAPAEPKQPF